MGIGTRLVGKRFVALASTAALTGAAGVAALGVLAGPAAAAAPLPAGCQSSATSIICTFAAPGEHAVPIPANTIAVTLSAVGGQGGDFSPDGHPGGVGASVTGSLNAATALAAGVLYAEVGGDGEGFDDDPCFPVAWGGANGGGLGECAGGLSERATEGGGGGASDVRTVPLWPDLPVGSIASLDSRVLVAAGGGGATIDNDGGAAGQAGAAADDPNSAGQPGTATGPGDNGYGTGTGSIGLGGTTSDHGIDDGGGGGGGGLWGGGGGDYLGQGGGGGGSSLLPNGGGSMTLASSTTPPSVTIDLTLAVCARILSGPHRALLITSSSGLTCINAATVTGGVTIAPRAQVLIANSNIDGSITSFDAATFTLCASTAAAVAVAATTGPVVIGNPTQPCAPNTLSSLITSGNTGGVTIEDNTISGGWTVTDNTPPATVNGNHH